MTISIEQQLDEANVKLLQASIDLLEKDNEIAELKVQLDVRDKRIAALEGAARRSTLPFKRDQTTPALRRGHLVRP
jgi:hypothetical protein